MENFETEEQHSQQPNGVLPKPLLVPDKQNWIRKSLISLAIYCFLFKVIFQLDFIYIAAVLVVLLIHELGHFFAMKAFNYTNVKLFVLPMLGAYVTGKKSTVSQKQMSVIVLAGPVPGIIIGFTLLLFNLYHPNDRIEMLGNIFFVLNLFNLLPFMPLDGGRLLETLFINHNHVIRVVFTIVSIICILIIAIISQNIFFLIIPASMVFELVMEIKNHKIREYLKQENINYVIDYNDLPNQHYWIIRDCIILSFNKRYAGVPAGVQQYSMAEGGLIQHVSAVLKTPIIKDLKALGKIMVMFLYVLFLVALPVFYVLAKNNHLF